MAVPEPVSIEEIVGKGTGKDPGTDGAKQCFKPVSELVEELNEHLAGWKNYFKVGYCRREFRKINYFVQCRMVRHLNRRSQRGYKLPKGTSVYGYLNQLGVIQL